MPTVDHFLAGNERRTADFAGGDLSMSPKTATILITCVDPRIEPNVIFDSRPGDVITIRSIGGRVTAQVIAQLGLLSALRSTVPDATAPSIVVMHHTECGTARFADPELCELAAARSGLDPASVGEIVVTDPFVSVAEDVDRLRSETPPGTRVVGRVYDVDTGEAIPV